jgi:hypothetical protein
VLPDLCSFLAVSLGSPTVARSSTTKIAIGPHIRTVSSAGPLLCRVCRRATSQNFTSTGIVAGGSSTFRLFAAHLAGQNQSGPSPIAHVGCAPRCQIDHQQFPLSMMSSMDEAMEKGARRSHYALLSPLSAAVLVS